MDFLPSPTPVPVSGGALGSELTLPFLVILGLAVLATVVVFAWRHRERT